MSEAAEVGSLIVRLMGDGSSHAKMLDDAEHGAEHAAQAIEQAGHRIEGFSENIKHFAEHAAHALESIEIGHWIREAFHEFGEAEHQSHRLEAALKTQGKNVEELSENYAHFAEDLQEITTLSHVTATGMLAQAESFGLSGEAAKRATKNAVAFAAAITGSADAAPQFMRITTAMEQGNVQLLRRLPGLRGVKDQTELLAKAQKILASGFEIAKSEANSSLGQFKQLKNLYDDFLESVGKVVAQAIHPFVESLKEVYKWLNELSPETKTFIASFAMVSAAFLALGPALALLGTIGGSIFSPVIVAIAAVSAAVSYLIVKLGGFGPLWEDTKEYAVIAWDFITEKVMEFGAFIQPWWDYLLGLFEAGWNAVVGYAVTAWSATQDATMAFWDWIKPVVQTGIDFILAVWDGLKAAGLGLWGATMEAAATAWEYIQAGWQIATGFISDLWAATGINIGQVLTTIRDSIRDAFIFAEFVIRNFGAVAEYIWVSMELGFVTFANQVQYFFTDVMPAFLDWFSNNWSQIFTDVFNLTVTIFENIGTNIWNFFKSIPGLIAGTTSFGDIWKPLTDGFEATVSEFPEIAARQMGETEKQLSGQAEELGGKLAEDFDKFREAKLDKLASKAVEQTPEIEQLPKEIEHTTEHAVNEADKLGQKTGATLASGMKKGKEKFDAAEFGSAEALARLAAFQEGTLGTEASSKGLTGEDAYGAGALAGEEGLLDDIHSGISELVDIGNKQLAKEPIEFTESGLT